MKTIDRIVLYASFTILLMFLIPILFFLIRMGLSNHEERVRNLTTASGSLSSETYVDLYSIPKEEAGEIERKRRKRSEMFSNRYSDVTSIIQMLFKEHDEITHIHHVIRINDDIAEYTYSAEIRDGDS